jgi:hypothetical protein
MPDHDPFDYGYWPEPAIRESKSGHSKKKAPVRGPLSNQGRTGVVGEIEALRTLRL